MNKGKLIVVEGIDGCGKTTQIKMLVDYLNKEGLPTVERSNVSSGSLGKGIRDVLLRGDLKLSNTELACLFIVELKNVAKEIEALLNEGTNVVCSRWYYSTLAYAGVSDVEYDLIDSLTKDILVPDIVFYLNVSVETAMNRINFRNETKEIYENVDKLTSIKNRYAKVWNMRSYDTKLITIPSDDAMSIDAIHTLIRNFIKFLNTYKEYNTWLL